VSAADRVTAIKVVAHTADGRVLECFQILKERDEQQGVFSLRLNQAIDDAGAELLAILRSRGLA
jgi:hypothetical protein